jgi:hypothetical protein
MPGPPWRDPHHVALTPVVAASGRTPSGTPPGTWLAVGPNRRRSAHGPTENAVRDRPVTTRQVARRFDSARAESRMQWFSGFSMIRPIRRQTSPAGSSRRRATVRRLLVRACSTPVHLRPVVVAECLQDSGCLQVRHDRPTASRACTVFDLRGETDGFVTCRLLSRHLAHRRALSRQRVGQSSGQLLDTSPCRTGALINRAVRTHHRRLGPTPSARWRSPHSRRPTSIAMPQDLSFQRRLLRSMGSWAWVHSG